MSAPVLALRGVDLTYGEGATAFTALRGITLDVRAGEFTLLLGPSGSGKTSLLQVMGCLLRASAGEVRLFDQSLAGLDAEALTARRLRHFGFVFQHYNLFPTLRAWENVAIALDLKRVPAADLRGQAIDLLGRLGLSDRVDHWPAQLSGGQKQRVAIARAIAGAPEVILADEPTAALDGRTGIGVAAALRELALERGCAVVVVSHDPRMLPYADRVLTLEDGAITDDRPGGAGAN
ncbi:MAG: ABC transporter ATP-binding protein [Xanthomonadaceae bacterium]|jgi:putative ABC transport system ATP-binding protein|nr:ABC transporter ATP-binding protein [Xanthomonadaceae bacterium]